MPVKSGRRTRRVPGQAQLRERFGQEGPANEIALGVIASKLPEHVERHLIFDPFRDDFKAEFVGQIDCRSNEDLVAPAVGDPGHKALVDLEFVNR